MGVIQFSQKQLGKKMDVFILVFFILQKSILLLLKIHLGEIATEANLQMDCN